MVGAKEGSGDEVAEAAKSGRDGGSEAPQEKPREEGKVEKEVVESPRAGSWYPLYSPVEALSKLKLTRVVEGERKKDEGKGKKKRRMSDRLAKSMF